jgi:hypothetical protein
MGGDSRVDQIAAEAAQARKCPVLVGSGEPRIADDVGHQDRRDFARFRDRAAREPSGWNSTKAVPLGYLAEQGQTALRTGARRLYIGDQRERARN